MAKREAIFTEEQLRQVTEEDEWYESEEEEESEVEGDWYEPVESIPEARKVASGGQPGVKVHLVTWFMKL